MDFSSTAQALPLTTSGVASCATNTCLSFLVSFLRFICGKCIDFYNTNKAFERKFCKKVSFSRFFERKCRLFRPNTSSRSKQRQRAPIAFSISVSKKSENVKKKCGFQNSRKPSKLARKSPTGKVLRNARFFCRKHTSLEICALRKSDALITAKMGRNVAKNSAFSSKKPRRKVKLGPRKFKFAQRKEKFARREARRPPIFVIFRRILSQLFS